MLSKKNHPLVIHGQSGSGKTSLMAMIAKNSFDWFEGKATVVLRYEIFMFMWCSILLVHLDQRSM
jgi:chromosomal replication initiation ATPase DnaA